jgi:mannosyltransferase
MKRSTALILLLLIIIVGIILRSYALTARSLWFDEAFSWRLIQFPLGEMVARDAQDVHPPLYYILLQWWSVVFGSSLLALRAFSVVMAGATIASMYLFVREAVQSRPVGLLAAALLAISGWQLQFAWEARMYTLGTFLVMISSWLLLKAVRQQPSRLSWWVVYAIVTVALAYVHYYAFFSIAAQIFFILGYILAGTRWRIGEVLHWRTFWHAIMAGVVMLVAYLPWLPTFLKQNSQVQDAYWIPAIQGWSIPDTFYRFFAPTPGIPCHDTFGCMILALIPITLTFVGLMLLLLTVRWRRSERRFTRQVGQITWDQWDVNYLIFLSAVVPFVLSIILSFVSQSLYQDRFFVFAHLFIVAALALLIGRLPSRTFRRGMSTLVLTSFVIGIMSLWQQLDLQNKPGAHGASRFIFEQREDHESIAVSSPFVYFAVLHYAVEEFGVDIPKLYSATGKFLHFAGGPILTANDFIGPELFTGENKSVWIVDTSGFGEQPLSVPANWNAIHTKKYPEVFPHQGDVIVTHYQRP